MRSVRPAFLRRASFAILLSASLSGKAPAAPATNAIESRTAEADGVKLHYLVSGRGPSVILLHGYAETSRMWRPLIPRLAEKFTVIAPDLPGIGDSEIPRDGSDMKTAAVRIHALARSLGIERARVVGHDIGLMVAYAYAALFPAEVEKAKDFEELSRTKLAMPVLSIGGAKANGTALGEQAKLVAADATIVVLENTGHWLMEENPQETMDALTKFL